MMDTCDDQPRPYIAHNKTGIDKIKWCVPDDAEKHQRLITIQRGDRNITFILLLVEKQGKLSKAQLLSLCLTAQECWLDTRDVRVRVTQYRELCIGFTK